MSMARHKVLICGCRKFFLAYAKSILKNIVQRDLTGVETKLKKSVLVSYSAGKFFLNLKGTPS
jgi:hypothetical protein